jgi:hypothetical protein
MPHFGEKKLSCDSGRCRDYDHQVPLGKRDLPSAILTLSADFPYSAIVRVDRFVRH